MITKLVMGRIIFIFLIFCQVHAIIKKFKMRVFKIIMRRMTLLCVLVFCHGASFGKKKGII